jgi:urea transport system permease protein
MTITQAIKRLALIAALLLMAHGAYALTAVEAKGIAIGEGDARIESLNKALANADEKTAAFLQALADDAVKTAGEQVFVMKDDRGFDPVTGLEVAVPEAAEDVMNNNRMRGELDTALAALKLFSKDDKIRGESIKTLLSETDETKLP